MRKAAILLLLAGLLMFGCVEERSTSSTGYEKIETVYGKDLDGDLQNEIMAYTYRPVEVDADYGIEMQKTAIVSPYSYAYSIAAYNEVALPQISDIQGKLQQFGSEKAQAESICTSRLALNARDCVDRESCVEACASKSCVSAAESGADTLGKYLQEYVDGKEKMGGLLDELLAMNGLSTQVQKELFVEKAVQLRELSEDAEANPLFNSDVFGLCPSPAYRVDLLEGAVAQVADVELAATHYRYRAFEVVTGGGGDEYIELFIRESPPLLLEAEGLSVDVSGDGTNTVYQKEPLKIGWENVGLEGPREVVEYDFVSVDAPAEDIMARWSVPSVLERNFRLLSYFNSVLQNPLFAFLFGVSAGAFMLFYSLGLGYFAALGIVLGLWVAAAALVVLALSAAYIAAKAYLDKKNMHDRLVDQLGPPLADWRMYAITGAVLLMVSVAVSLFFVSPVEIGALDVTGILTKLSTNLVGALAAFVMVVAVYSLFIVGEDRLKGLALGQEYYSIKGATKEEDVKLLNELKRKLGELKERVEGLSRMGMNVDDEYATLVSIPVERFEQMIEVGKVNMAKQLITFNTDMLLEMEKKLDQKEEVMSKNWPEWKEEIDRAVKLSEQVPLETLLSIPVQWRDWAARKYLSEHRGRALVLEDGMIKRRKIAVEEIVSRMMADFKKSGLVKAGILLHKGKPVYNSFSKGNRTVGTVLFMKLSEYAKGMAKKFGDSELKRLVVSGKGNVAVYLVHGDYRALLFTERGSVRELLETWNKSLETAG